MGPRQRKRPHSSGRGRALTLPATIYTLHGVAPNLDLRRFIYRNISDEKKLTAILGRRRAFVPLKEALAGNGDALTIDDATRASADAALLARQYGHHVTLFVNPGQVDPPRPYSFNLLAVLIDGVSTPSVEISGQRFPARTPADREAIRGRMKQQLRDIESEAERRSLVERLAAEWGNIRLDLPDFLATITKQELKQLRDEGVDIQNHGWSHACHRRLSTAESQSEIDLGKQWLLENLGVTADIFAVPFGDVLPSDGVTCPCWLTLDHRLPVGRLGETVWNRDTLHSQPDGGVIDDARIRARRFIRRAKRRLNAYRETIRRAASR